MDPSCPGLWLVPTKGRVETKLPRFLAACLATGVTTPGAILVEEEEYVRFHEAYDALDLPEGWFVAPVKGGCTAASTEEGWKTLCPDAAWIGWLADDLIAQTPGWDRLCISRLNGYNVVSTNDGALAPKRMNGATVWSGDLVRAVGYIYAPDLRHFYLDSVWEELGRMTTCWQVDMSVLVRHANAEWEGEGDQTTATISTNWEHDRKAYYQWQKTDGLGAVDRVIALMEEHGVKIARWDFRGIKLCVATPCGTGRFEAAFMRSLNNTEAFIKQFGGEFRFMELTGCSDIALGRNRLLANSMIEDWTHLLWIDDDMVWEPTDVGHLLNAKKDFCAVAGPLKVYPQTKFAASCSDDFGAPVPLRVDPQSQFLEVTSVGMAFTLLTRAACERMIQSFPDLQYVNAMGQTETGVFLPMIVNRLWKGEDFAFCWRWTHAPIHGKIFVAHGISLGHIGSHMWKGSWAEALAKKAAEQQEAA